MLISEATAKSYLRLSDEEATEVELTLEMFCVQATDIVIDYLKKPDHDWTVDDVPPHIRAAILHVLKRLYDDRGAELEGGPLPDHIKALLERDRDPALA